MNVDPAPSNLYLCTCRKFGIEHVVTEDDMLDWLAAWGDDTENVMCSKCLDEAWKQEEYLAQCQEDWDWEVAMIHNLGHIEQ